LKVEFYGGKMSGTFGFLFWSGEALREAYEFGKKFATALK